MSQFKDITGKTIGNFKIIKRGANDSRGKARWICKCICGKKVLISGYRVREKVQKSCGCLTKYFISKEHTTHGKTQTTEYRSWASMKNRCYNNKLVDFKNYGGRGIIVCDRWLNSFENFYRDMGKKPTAGHSIDRFPNKNGNYEPTNCRWATKVEQVRNQRSNIWIEYNGKNMLQKDWETYFNVSGALIRYYRKQGRIQYFFDKQTKIKI